MKESEERFRWNDIEPLRVVQELFMTNLIGKDIQITLHISIFVLLN